MAKLCLKKASKRVSCAKRYKIEKKVKDHNKKVKKVARKAGDKRKPAVKPITVPNSCPFKEEILQAAEKQREFMIAQKEAAKVVAKQRKTETKKEKKAPSTVEQLASKAEEEGLLHELRVPLTEKEGGLSDKTVKQFAGEVRKTIENADIVIEVLDARDPLGSRDQLVEKQCVLAGKRLVLLLNKIDLVPKENVEAWLVYLRRFYPTIAFKASTQEQNTKLGRFTSSNIHSASTSKCVGADLVMKLLANYCRNRDIKTSIRVGIIGFPNVGKSSVINSLKRKRACNVGAMPGITKQMQEVELDKHIRLIDSPGVILASNRDLDPVEVALKNAVRVDSLSDPTVPVHAILRRCSRETLMLHYTIAEFSNCDQFLALVARKLGRLKKGGTADLNAAARHVLHEWNTGKLRYYTLPPEEGTSGAVDDRTEDETKLVEAFSKEFDIDALEEMQKAVVYDAPMEGETAVLYDPNVEVQLENEEGMEVDGEEGRVVVEGGKKKKKGGEEKDDNKLALPESLEMGDGNVALNSAIRKAVKKQRRKNKKTNQRAERMFDSFGGALLKEQDESME